MPLPVVGDRGRGRTADAVPASAWLARLEQLLEVPHGGHRTVWADPVPDATLLWAGRRIASYAQAGTGRTIELSRDTIASATRTSPATVGRIYRELNALGLAVLLTGIRDPHRVDERPHRGDGSHKSSWSLPAPEGAYASIPAWSSPESYLAIVERVLATPEGEAIRKKHKVARKTLLAEAAAEVPYADRATGRGVTVAKKVIAAEIRRSDKTVQRARRALEELGLAKEIVTGRRLTAEERAIAHQVHRKHQVFAASVRALTPGKNVHLSISTRVKRSSSAVKAFQEPAWRRGDGKVATRLPSSRPKGRRAADKRPPAWTNPAPTVLSAAHDERWESYRLFASQLQARMSWLLGDLYVGQVIRVLKSCRIEPSRWEVSDLVNALTHGHQEHGGGALPRGGQVHDPRAYLAWMIRRGVSDPAAETPTEAYRRRRQEQLERTVVPRVAAGAESPQFEVQPATTTTSFLRLGSRVLPTAGGARQHELDEITVALIGHLSIGSVPSIQRQRVRRAHDLHRRLTERHWTLDPDSLSGHVLIWTRTTPAGVTARVEYDAVEDTVRALPQEPAND